jgi:hypothetical protein
MYSPFKFCDFCENSFLIAEDKELSVLLSNFFKQKENEYLWTLNVHRQTTTYSLRNTESIMLRKLSLNKMLKNTSEYNQVLEVEDSEIISKIPIFTGLREKFENIFKSKGVKKIEWGRIFFSKLLAESDIDTHIDEGKYFSYFDRFHFVISSPKNCVFHIREEDVFLKQGSLYWVNNHVPHWLKNYGKTDRINLIFDARLE